MGFQRSEESRHAVGRLRGKHWVDAEVAQALFPNGLDGVKESRCRSVLN